MVKKDIVFYSYLLFWFIIGIFIAIFTNINVWVFGLIMTGIFSILCIIKKTNKKFNNWLESEL